MDKDTDTSRQGHAAAPLANAALGKLRKRLLDLTARNRLINFKHTTGASLRVIDELPNQLVEALLSDREMRFLAIPEPTEKQLVDAGYLERDPQTRRLSRLRKDPTAEEWAKHLEFNTSYEVPRPNTKWLEEKHKDYAIQTLMYPYEMEVRLKKIYQASESAIQEMGANILYLTFGFLEWFDSVESDAARIAPLFLIPVRLHKGRLNKAAGTYDYTLTYSGEEIIPNLSLREKLKADFELVLPELDEDTEPEDYFDAVVELIETNQPRWKLHRYISLGLLNFSKLLMYLDLDPGRWPEEENLIDHPVVSRFLSDYEEEPGGGQDYGFGEEYQIDEIEDIHLNYPLIDDADSSQHSALIDAIDGKNLVIEGPPGTGKSQTITNLIAAAMAQGKKVLFVAEKLAALEVVKRRLDAAGLGAFCLELHSHKTQKRKVLDEVEERIKKRGRFRKPKEITVDIARYEELKKALVAHADRINQNWKKTGKSSHEIFMAATRYRESVGENPERFHPTGYDGDNYDPVAQRRNEDQVEVYQRVFRSVAEQLESEKHLNEHPWFGVQNTDLQLFDRDRVITGLEEWQAALDELSRNREDIADFLQVSCDRLPVSVNGFKAYIHGLAAIPPLEGNEILTALPLLHHENLDSAKSHLDLFKRIQESYESLGKTISPEVLGDLSIVESLIEGSEQLRHLVGDGISLSSLSEALNRLSAIESLLSELVEPMNGVAESVGGVVREHLSFTEAGIMEFGLLIKLVSSLDAKYWKARDDVFDNDELDSLIPELMSETQSLRLQAKALKPLFKLNALPKGDDIRKLGAVWSSGGFLWWLKKPCREARQYIKALGNNPKARVADLSEKLSDLANFSDEYRSFKGRKGYREALGDQFQGLATDVEAIAELRLWYRKVREQYGIGFGKKVQIGDAIISLSPSIAKGIRSLSERGVAKTIDDLIEDLGSLKAVFVPVAELKQDDALLVGENGIIPRIVNGVKASVSLCGPLVEDDNLTLAEIADRIESISFLKDSVETLEQENIDRDLFEGRLGLEPGIDKDNTGGVSALENTIVVAEALAESVSHSPTIDFIRENSTASTFQTIADFVASVSDVLSSESTAHTGFSDLMELDEESWTQNYEDTLEDNIERNRVALSHPDTLQTWLDYVRVRNQLSKLGVSGLIEAIEVGDIDVDNARASYQAGIYDFLAREVLAEDPELAQFSGHTQEALQAQFQEYDNRLKSLQCEQIASQIDKNDVPRGRMAALVRDRTELVLLEHECGKKTRHLPIRQLLQRAGEALVSLKPCFMMGPMSVAQYLAPGKFNFDLVVMDEASQIRPQDALGAIARGTQLVVVGDPKQLPPTSFFDRMMDDSDDEDVTGLQQSESILDATLPMFPARRLRWHYRSQHENLIAFSNKFYYDNDLVLFPSPHKETDLYGIKYSRVRKGTFVNRKNLEEARVISEAVREHFRSCPQETLGVVAMSAEQRLQIEVAIEALAKSDTLFQEWLEKDAHGEEPLFVKNLENVQGDERDVIFISMTYGPSEPGGKVAQRFGPISYDVGWRRLNVLFTRSKKRMHIFSSMGPENIVADASKSRGVKSLRDFLNYCETGIIHKTDMQTDREPDSDFEIAVMHALRDHGFECVPQVGVAGFFIDVAVLDPGNPGKYLMGIECDGATYHSAKSARDRDRLRQAILERLGWNIRRIWSTDWFQNPHGELLPIVRELNELKSESIIEPERESSEANKIEEIVQHDDELEQEVEQFAFSHEALQDKLVRFNEEVIVRAFPGTSDSKRLLRPSMIEALLEYEPTNKEEFLELIPAYMRTATDAKEGIYLDQVFEIINASI